MAVKETSIEIDKRKMSKFWLIFFASLASMVAPFSIDTYIPSFPAIESYYGVSRELLSTSMGAYLAAFAITTLVWGPLADRFGRKYIALVSLLGFLLASMGCALAPSFDGFMIFRVFQGVLAGGVIISARAMVRDYFPPQEAQKTMALVMMVFAIAPAIAPIVGGYLQAQFDWESIFWFLSGYALLTIAILLFFIVETQHPEHVQSIAPKPLMRSYWQTIKHPLFIKVVLAQALLFAGMFVYIAGSASLMFDHLKLGPQDFWMQFVPMVGGMILGSMVVHRMTGRYAPNHIVLFSYLVTGLAASMGLVSSVLLEPQVLSIIPFISLYAFAMAMSLPVLSILALDCLPHKRGMAASLQSLMQMGMAAVIAIVVVPLVHESLVEMALAMFVLWLIAVLLWVTVSNKLED
ncbi:Bcr/CflA family drug resistance efflux transporter [Thiomicrorhabdus immobilis]|uniref:Bcr/CflA family efflux transporter n=1 Tax=Thiomicrorhabdus immobilis TaxID=2791037 RepID=A0ABN6CYU2_9GAMM|nr:multidrug effflux MFS transporter [Thiomicrorhabdus immobilis]BCN94300.1 Bcr/CflA family drug resistance efflux transporter [Thiomicrorhabdus immobilis]